MTMTAPRLLTQNRDLRRTGIFAWTLPALGARLPDGRTVLTCPSAGVCAALCYARQGTFRFPAVKAAHARNLALVLDDLPGWEACMDAELSHPRYAGRSIRVHDAGDFFSRAYAEAWLRLARRHPGQQFYAYTKEVRLFKTELAAEIPANFTLIYSLGGTQDSLIDRATDRHCEVFPDEASLHAAGYVDNAADDAIAYQSDCLRIGIVANNIPHLRKRQGASTFGALQVSS